MAGVNLFRSQLASRRLRIRYILTGVGRFAIVQLPGESIRATGGGSVGTRLDPFALLPPKQFIAVRLELRILDH